jgi:hypothetical protein
MSSLISLSYPTLVSRGSVTNGRINGLKKQVDVIKLYLPHKGTSMSLQRTLHRTFIVTMMPNPAKPKQRNQN